MKAVRKTIVNPAVLTYYKEPVYAHQVCSHMSAGALSTAWAVVTYGCC